MISIIILTSSMEGSAAYLLEEIIKSKKITIKAVVFSENKIINKKKYYKKKLIKALRIGPLGVLNGIRMRRWYSDGTTAYLNIKPLNKICEEYTIPFNITPTINCSQTIAFFENAKADIGLSLGNGYIKSEVFSIPRLGMINIHHEELPEYQNAQSIIWQLYNNNNTTAYTIHRVDKHIDTGEIVYQEKVPIIFRASLADTVAYTYAELWKKSAKGLIMVLEDLDNHLCKMKPQGIGISYTTPNFFQFLKIVRNFRMLKKELIANRP